MAFQRMASLNLSRNFRSFKRTYVAIAKGALVVWHVLKVRLSGYYIRTMIQLAFIVVCIQR